MRRNGFALVGALISVVLLGALIVGAFVATTEEVRISGNIRTGARAQLDAESVLESERTGWAAAKADSLAIAQRAYHSATIGDIEVDLTLVRLDSGFYWMAADAREPGRAGGSAGSVRRRIGLLLRSVTDSAGRTMLLRLEERPWFELF